MSQYLAGIRSTEQRIIVDNAHIRKDSSLSVRIAELQSGTCADCRHMCYTICLKFGGRVNPMLLVISGSLRDRTSLMHRSETPVCRAPGNLVDISDPMISRR